MWFMTEAAKKYNFNQLNYFFWNQLKYLWTSDYIQFQIIKNDREIWIAAIEINFC